MRHTNGARSLMRDVGRRSAVLVVGVTQRQLRIYLWYIKLSSSCKSPRALGMHTARMFPVALAATLVGCAAPLVKPSPDEHLDASWRLYTSPGAYQRYGGDLDVDPAGAPKRIGLDFRFSKLNPSPQWGPTFLFCAYGEDELPASCMRFSASANSKYLEVRAEVDTDLTSPPSTTTLPESPLSAKTHRLNVTFNDFTVKYYLDGHGIHEQRLPITPQKYFLACSSANCDIQIITQK
jgi:hypothetical protein